MQRRRKHRHLQPLYPSTPLVQETKELQYMRPTFLLHEVICFVEHKHTNTVEFQKTLFSEGDCTASSCNNYVCTILCGGWGGGGVWWVWGVEVRDEGVVVCVGRVYDW